MLVHTGTGASDDFDQILLRTCRQAGVRQVIAKHGQRREAHDKAEGRSSLKVYRTECNAELKVSTLLRQRRLFQDPECVRQLGTSQQTADRAYPEFSWLGDRYEGNVGVELLFCIFFVVTLACLTNTSDHGPCLDER